LAGAEEVLTGLVAADKPLLPVLASFSSAEEFDDRRVMSGGETGAGVVAAVFAGAGCAAVGFGAAGVETGAEIGAEAVTGCGVELLVPLK
jgi:hypothetical protein